MARFKIFGRGAAAEARAAIHRPAEAELVEERSRVSATFTQSDGNFLQLIGWAADGVGGPVTIDQALQVPAIFCAVNFLSRTMAGIPIKAFERIEGGRQEAKGDNVAALFNRAPNDETAAFAARQEFWQNVFTSGRAVWFIDRTAAGKVINLWPLDVAQLRVERRAGRKLYHYKDAGRPITYAASDVIDLCFMPMGGGLSARSPVYSNSETIGLARAITRYGARFFDNGGVPPFTITGPIKSAGGVERASADMTRAVQAAAASGSNAVAVPEGHTLSPLGIDPEKMQMIEAQRFIIEQIARIFGLPPAFLQDLTHGTFSNVEQQDLQLVKHLVAHWARAFESEVNLKLYGREGGRVYLENVLDGLLRGDLLSRAEAITKRVQSGQLTPNEARELENRPPLPGGQHGFIQGAMVTLTSAAAPAAAN